MQAGGGRAGAATAPAGCGLAHRVEAGAGVELEGGGGRRVGQHQRIGQRVDVQGVVVLPVHRLRWSEGVGESG